MATVPEVVEVGVKSAWASKINVAQAVGYAASITAAVFGVDLPKEEIIAIILGIQGAVTVTTWVMRTFFTTKLTPSSAAKV